MPAYTQQLKFICISSTYSVVYMIYEEKMYFYFLLLLGIKNKNAKDVLIVKMPPTFPSNVETIFKYYIYIS